jgi:hypothetical protein
MDLLSMLPLLKGWRQGKCGIMSFILAIGEHKAVMERLCAKLDESVRRRMSGLALITMILKQKRNQPGSFQNASSN